MKGREQGRIGELIPLAGTETEPYCAYVPQSLPPDPKIQREDLQVLLERAGWALGALDGAASVHADINPLLDMYVRKEAVFSCQMDGGRFSLTDLLLYESEDEPSGFHTQIRPVSLYAEALKHGWHRVKSGEALSLPLIRDVHHILMAAGKSPSPVEFRSSQTWIGGKNPAEAVYIPPPPDRVFECMMDLERFLGRTHESIPVLYQAAMAHHQFLSIQPFSDGNGRFARLLVTLLLAKEQLLSSPILFLSVYFCAHRDRYCHLLQHVRETGDWESWVEFFLQGVEKTALLGAETLNSSLTLISGHRKQIGTIGRGAGSALKIHTYLQRKPVAAIPEMVRALRLSAPTVASTLQKLQEINIVREVTGKQRGRIFVYDSYLKLFQQGPPGGE